MRLIAAVLWWTACLWIAAALSGVARADPGGQMPGPDLCDYPGVGDSGLDGIGVYHYWCDFPPEENGSHWHQQDGGAASQGQVGVSFMMFNASIAAEVGVIHGWSRFVCPDGREAADWPNPPGAWKNYLVPRKCVSKGPVITLPSPGPPPVEPPPGTPGTEGGHLAPVTNPVTPNPEATTNDMGRPGD